MNIANATSRQSLYVRCAAAADRGAWSVERDIDWSAIDRRALTPSPRFSRRFGTRL